MFCQSFSSLFWFDTRGGLRQIELEIISETIEKQSLANIV